MNRAELVTKLELVGRALADSNMVPIFQCFVFDGTNVIAYNDALGIVAPCTTDEAFAVNGATLLGLLRNSQSEDVTFTLDGTDLVVKAGKSNFKLPYETEDAFLFEEPEDEWDCNLPLAGLIGGIDSCLLTSGRDLAQEAFMGVLLKDWDLYSCDGDAVSRFHMPVKGVKSNVVSCMMPNAFCETLLKIEQPKQLEVNKEWAKATFEGYTVYGRLIENDHPLDHESEIKKTIKSEPTYIAIPEGLDHALSRARVVADAESKPTQLTVDRGMLTLLTDTHLGVVRDVLTFKHPDVVALVSSELLQRSIGITTEMAILENCCCFKSGDELFCLLSNYG